MLFMLNTVRNMWQATMVFQIRAK